MLAIVNAVSFDKDKNSKVKPYVVCEYPILNGINENVSKYTDIKDEKKIFIILSKINSGVKL